MDTMPPAADKASQAHRLPHTCSGCTARWGGFRTAHCAACHQTFTTPANFDMHRAGTKDREHVQGECSDPAARGLVRNERGHWAMPGRDEGAE